MSTATGPTAPPAPLDRAIDAADGVGALAELIGVNQTTVSMWRTRGKGRVPPEHCAAIHKATGVPRWELRPDDWHRIWPELIGTEGAPDVPAADAPTTGPGALAVAGAGQ